jgi:hypothetical protein
MLSPATRRARLRWQRVQSRWRGLAAAGEPTAAVCYAAAFCRRRAATTPRASAVWCHASLNFPDSASKSMGSRFAVSNFSWRMTRIPRTFLPTLVCTGPRSLSARLTGALVHCPRGFLFGIRRDAGELYPRQPSSHDRWRQVADRIQICCSTLAITAACMGLRSGRPRKLRASSGVQSISIWTFTTSALQMPAGLRLAQAFSRPCRK